MNTILRSTIFVVVITILTLYYFSRIFIYRFFAILRRKPVNQNYIHQLACRWGKAVLTRTPGWGIEVKGQELLPPDGQPYVLIANHESLADILALYCLGIQFRWLAKDGVFKVPLVGAAMRWAGYVEVKRGDPDSHVKAMQHSAACLSAQVPMLFFPEGTRSTTGKIGEFKKGAFRLAREAKVPVLPIVLHGAGYLLKKRTICPRAAIVQIEVLPLLFSNEGESINEFTQRARNLMIEHHSRMDLTSAPLNVSS